MRRYLSHRINNIPVGYLKKNSMEKMTDYNVRKDDQVSK